MDIFQNIPENGRKHEIALAFFRVFLYNDIVSKAMHGPGNITRHRERAARLKDARTMFPSHPCAAVNYRRRPRYRPKERMPYGIKQGGTAKRPFVPAQERKGCLF